MNEITIDIKSKIYTIRDKQVMLDRDLAELYGVETKHINQAVRNNPNKFPDGFIFELSKNELENLRSKILTSSWGGSRYVPKVFTEQGIYMLATVLKSRVATDVTVMIVKTFANMRKLISNNDFFIKQLETIEKRQISYEVKSDANFEKIFKALENKEHIKEQGIFYNGQIFDAYKFASDLIKSAKTSIILIDNYIDDTTLTLFSKNQKADITIYTHTISKQLKQDLAKYNSQYKPLHVKATKDFHDRFLILDKTEIYHIGASLKDLGKKVFGFSKMRDFSHPSIKI